MIIVGGLSAAVGIWLGQMLGDMNRYGHEVVESENTSTAGLTTSWMYIAFAVGTVLFVVTAAPPA
jgi:hypothetical protein